MRRHCLIVSVVVILIWPYAAISRAAEAESRAAWSSDIHDLDDGPLGDDPPAISLVGAKNGAFSGKIVMGAGQVAKVSMSDLKPVDAKSGAAAIPAANVRVRYAVPAAGLGPELYRPPGNDLLLESPPAEPRTKLPVWVTVSVPKDAKAGAYAGQLSLELKGDVAIHVPVKIDVRDWILPGPQDYRTWVELVQSPDTLAVEYDTPLWSQKHWDLIARSFDLMAATGTRVVYLPLLARTNYGNAESMVRWVRKGDGYEYDFSIMDKYLDLVEKHLGKPKLTLLYAWEVYLKPPRDKWTQVDPNDPHGAAGQSRLALEGKGPAVTLVDPGSGKTDLFRAPRYETPEGKAAWKPVFDGVRERLAKRGLEKTMMVGQTSDEWPAKEEVTALGAIDGNLPWTSCAHHLNTIVPYKTLGNLQPGAPFGYAAVALDFYFNFNPAKGGHQYGWNQPLSVQFWRFQYFNAPVGKKGISYVEVRHAAEVQITGNKRGIGHLGADFWPCVRARNGARGGWVTDRFPESFWHNLHIQSWLLGPGPDGPVGTTRMEIFREGIQECEARIAIESVLRDDGRKAKLGADLAKRAQDHLDQRLIDIWKSAGVSQADLDQYGLITTYRTWYGDIRSHQDHEVGTAWFIKSSWQQQDGRLFDLAGEVAAKNARP